MRESLEVEQLSEVFRQLGAGESQALVMARQLSKRATQVAQERGVSRLDALRDLLRLVQAGRSGEPYGSSGGAQGE